MRILVVLVLVLGVGCKKQTAQASAPSGAQKGARADKPAEHQGAPIELAAVVDGKPAVVWTRAELSKVKVISISGDSGEGQRNAWSLRDIVGTLVDPKAVVVALEGEAGGSMKIESSLWNDPSKQPVLRQNRRGFLKFYWVDAAGKPLEGDGLRGVHQITIKHL